MGKNWGLLLAPLMGVLLLCAGTIPATLDSRTILERSVHATDADWDAAPNYDFTEKDRTPTGNVTYRVRMILGSPYNERIKENGKPLTGQRKAEEQKRLNETIAARRAESPDERAKRIKKYQVERQRDHLFMSQLSQAFDFRLAGEDSVGPFRVWVMRATPRPGYRPPNLEAEALTGMAGTLWIDEKTFQWVKVEAHVTRPVSIAGFLATVEPGTYFELEQAPVTDKLWLPRHFAMRSRAKVLFVIRRRSSADETYTDYTETGNTVSGRGLPASPGEKSAGTGRPG